jgi:hypothetical protein
LKAFVDDTAAETGKGRSTIAREVKRGADIRDVAQLAGTSLDSGAELDAMARLPEAEQRKLATAAKAGRKVSAFHRYSTWYFCASLLFRFAPFGCRLLLGSHVDRLLVGDELRHHRPLHDLGVDPLGAEGVAYLCIAAVRDALRLDIGLQV